MFRWKVQLLDRIRRKLGYKVLHYIHIPKCGGTYARMILRDLGIAYTCHELLPRRRRVIYFTTIREPVERFESLLNFRLEKKPEMQFPKRLRYAISDKSVSLDEIVSGMTDSDIRSFVPFRTMRYYARNCDFCLTIDEFIPALKILGYKVRDDYKALNMTNKERGCIGVENRKRIEYLFESDMMLYRMWTGDERKLIFL